MQTSALEVYATRSQPSCSLERQLLRQKLAIERSGGSQKEPDPELREFQKNRRPATSATQWILASTSSQKPPNHS